MRRPLLRVGLGGQRALPAGEREGGSAPPRIHTTPSGSQKRQKTWKIRDRHRITTPAHIVSKMLRG